MHAEEDREQEPIVALAREIRFAHEQLVEGHLQCTEILDFSTDSLDQPLDERAQKAIDYIVEVRKQDEIYTSKLQKATDIYDSRMKRVM